MLDMRLYSYIWKHTRLQQAWILVIVALSMIPYFMAFSLPKDIVNGPIQGAGFETADATQVFMRLSVPLPGMGDVLLFPGVELDRVEMLFALSAVFLGLVIINGLFKFYINTYKGRLGERLLRRIRFSLVDHILRFPPSAFKHLKGAEVASMVKDEVEPLGGFTGDAFVSPALLGGQALTALIFIFVQSVPLGLVTASLVGVQVFIIPRMRRRLLVLGRERQLTTRQLAGRVSEIVDGIGTIHANDTSNFERADVAARLGRIFTIRFDIYQWKFMVKFINNFLASLTPFLFYSLGGYLALKGHLDIGQLVAVIGAYKDLPGPLKELIDWDQNRQDVEVKYQQVISQFAIDGIMDPEIHTPMAKPPALEKPLAAVSLGVVDDSGAASLERVNLSIDPSEALAVLGAAGSGSDTLAEVFARQVWPSSGRVTAGETNLLTLPEAVSGRSISYAGADSYFFSGTVLDNLLYGLKNSPPPPGAASPHPMKDWQRQECLMSGNPVFDPEGDWIDYAALGLSGQEALMQRVSEVLDCVDLTRDTQDLALRSTVSAADHPELANRIVAMRRLLHEELHRSDLSGLVVPFEAEAFNAEATVIENLLFGRVRPPAQMNEILETSPFFQNLLKTTGLFERFTDIGLDIARTVIGLFADLPPDHPFFRQMTLMTADDLPAYQALVQKFDNPAAQITDGDRIMMILLAFEYIESRHRFGLVDADLMAEVVAFRRTFHASIPPDLLSMIELYNPSRFMDSGSLLDNVLFGKVSEKYRDGVDQIRAVLIALLHQSGTFAEVLKIGLNFEVGPSGRRLSPAQRQKIALARALVRQSDYYVFNRPLSALDSRSQERVLVAVLDRWRKTGQRPGVLWVLVNPVMARHFDRIAVFNEGRLAQDGTFDELSERNGIFKDMIGS